MLSSAIIFACPECGSSNTIMVHGLSHEMMMWDIDQKIILPIDVIEILMNTGGFCQKCKTPYRFERYWIPALKVKKTTKNVAETFNKAKQQEES